MLSAVAIETQLLRLLRNLNFCLMKYRKKGKKISKKIWVMKLQLKTLTLLNFVSLQKLHIRNVYDNSFSFSIMNLSALITL